MAQRDGGPVRSRYDVVVVGGGHNGLTAAAYLARAKRSVLVLEQLDHLGGAAVSARVFPGVDARLSRYSYLVSLLPRQIVDELGLALRLVRRRVSSYTPVPGDPGRALLVDEGDRVASAASFAAVSGQTREWHAWQRFYAMTGRMAQVVFPSMTSPLQSPDLLRQRVGDDAWDPFVRRPLGELLERTFADDTVRGVALTDALIGTFVDAGSESLRQNRCFLYHVIGDGTGHWDVPVGGMGAVTDALAAVAASAGATLLTGADVTSVTPEGEVAWVDASGAQHVVGAGHVLAGCAPATLARLMGQAPRDLPQGAQLKVNLVLSRLPRLRERSVDPATAFSGTFHVNEGYEQLQTAYDEATAGRIPTLPPCEVYCHSLTDPTILGPALRASGAHTLTLFGLHMPAALFAADNQAARAAALAATLRSLDSVLAEPIGDCVLLAPDGSPCVEARTPLDLQSDVGLPGGHIFHGDLSWPWATTPDLVGTWGVETTNPKIMLCGAGARRGGGVSAIPGRAAAMAVLAAR